MGGGGKWQTDAGCNSSADKTGRDFVFPWLVDGLVDFDFLSSFFLSFFLCCCLRAFVVVAFWLLLDTYAYAFHNTWKRGDGCVSSRCYFIGLLAVVRVV
jgi:hypothetical protein